MMQHLKNPGCYRNHCQILNPVRPIDHWLPLMLLFKRQGWLQTVHVYLSADKQIRQFNLQSYCFMLLLKSSAPLQLLMESAEECLANGFHGQVKWTIIVLLWSKVQFSLHRHDENIKSLVWSRSNGLANEKPKQHKQQSIQYPGKQTIAQIKMTMMQF